MNILADLHHADLYYSLYLLFEKRLGHTLYSPLGLEWYQENIWQHLITGPYGSTMPCVNPNDCDMDDVLDNGIVTCRMPSQNYNRRGITLSAFKRMDFDIIISSLPVHWKSFNDIIRFYQPKAKHIAQIGNLGQDWSTCPVKNVMSSVPPSCFAPEHGQRVVYYDQEFSLDTFKCTAPTENADITSFIHCMPQKELFKSYAHVLPEFKFRNYGFGEASKLSTLNDIAECMQQSMFGWHVKPGDGYGHILHNWLACGRPVITRLSDYRHRTDRLIHGQSCIDLDANSFSRNVELIREWSEPEAHKKMCESTYKIFKEHVDFDRDAENVEQFLECLL